MAEKMVSIKNHGPCDVVLGDIHVDDPAMPGQKYVRAGEVIKVGKVSQPMPASVFKFYDVPSIRERVAAGELEMLVDGQSKMKPAPAPAPDAGTIPALQQQPTKAAADEEADTLAALLGGGAKAL